MSREDKIYNAKLAEQAERYDDMVNHMKEVVKVERNRQSGRADKNSPTRTATSLASPTRTGLAPAEQPGELSPPSNRRRRPRAPSTSSY